MAEIITINSSWEAILSRVPVGSILGSLFFNKFMCDRHVLDIKNTYFTGYGNANTPFVVRDDITDVTGNKRK